MPEVVAGLLVPWRAATPVQAGVALPWRAATPVQSLGRPFTPAAPPPGGTETSDGSLAATTAIAASPGGYHTTHTLSMVLDATGAELPVDSVNIALEDGSIYWTLRGTADGSVFDLLAGGAEVPTVTVTIDGLVWRFLLESVSRPRAFASDRISFIGRSLAASAAAPYELERNWIGEAPTTAAQIAAGAQQVTGLEIDWQLDDWAVPAGVLSFFGTPAAVVQHVAQAAGAVLTAHPSEYRLTVAPRYPLLPDQWLCVPPDVQVAWDAVETESYERADQPAYDAVLVSGQQQGAFGVVRVVGSAGNSQAPMVTDPLLTDEPALRQRGQAVLGASGPQARVTRTLPVLTGAGQPGVIARGALVRFVDPDEVWAGVVRSVSVQAALPVVQQTITIERHTATVAGPPAPPPLVFNGPIPDINVEVGAAVDIDLSGYWSGGQLPYAFTLRAGTLPAGLVLTPAGRLFGEATGSEAQAGVRVRAQDAVSNMADSGEFEVTAAAASSPASIRLRFENVGDSALDNDGFMPNSKVVITSGAVLSADNPRHGSGSIRATSSAYFTTPGFPSADHAAYMSMPAGASATLRYWATQVPFLGTFVIAGHQIRWDLSSPGPFIFIDGVGSNGSLRCRVYDETATLVGTITSGPRSAGWVHIEVGIDASNLLYFFVEGVLIGSTACPTARGDTQNARIAALNASAGEPAYLDDFELTIGSCLHTASFTPPGPL